MRDPRKARETDYAKEWYGKFQEHYKELVGKVDTTSNGKIAKTNRNTQLLAHVLLETFNDMGDFMGIMGIISACDFSEINNVRRTDYPKEEK